MQVLQSSLAVVHALAGAAWFGSMFYSYSVLHPRARAYFHDPRDFENFIATVSQGARWKVLGAFAIVLLSGIGLLWLGRARLHDGYWAALLAAKMVFFAMALGIFCYASWILWPRRIFAAPDEIAAMQRAFRTIARLLILLVGLSFVLGVLAHF